MLQSGSPPGRSVRSTRGVFATLLCSFILQAVWRFWVALSPFRPFAHTPPRRHAPLISLHPHSPVHRRGPSYQRCLPRDTLA
jgi:hypothetical protein